MSVLLFLLAVFFAILVWYAGMRLWRLLRVASGSQRFFGQRTVGD